MGFMEGLIEIGIKLSVKNDKKIYIIVDHEATKRAKVN